MNLDIEKIEQEETQRKKFARGMNFYKLFWIFFIGCFLGVVIETVWCLVKRGHYESRVGLIYGPFNLVYGFGALAMAVGLHWLRKKRKLYIFLGGFVTGSVVEYVCSFVQEKMFGSVSWDYSALPFNLSGRINLLYSVFWGLLAILWIKILYPLLSLLIMKIPDRVGKILTYALLVFLIFDTLMSALAVIRWQARISGRAGGATSVIWKFFDEHYPNKKMKRIYPNMKFRAPKSP